MYPGTYTHAVVFLDDEGGLVCRCVIAETCEDAAGVAPDSWRRDVHVYPLARPETFKVTPRVERDRSLAARSA